MRLFILRAVGRSLLGAARRLQLRSAVSSTMVCAARCVQGACAAVVDSVCGALLQQAADEAAAVAAAQLRTESASTADALGKPSDAAAPPQPAGEPAAAAEIAVAAGIVAADAEDGAGLGSDVVDLVLVASSAEVDAASESDAIGPAIGAVPAMKRALVERSVLEVVVRDGIAQLRESVERVMAAASSADSAETTQKLLGYLESMQKAQAAAGEASAKARVKDAAALDRVGARVDKLWDALVPAPEPSKGGKPKGNERASASPPKAAAAKQPGAKAAAKPASKEEVEHEMASYAQQGVELMHALAKRLEAVEAENVRREKALMSVVNRTKDTKQAEMITKLESMLTAQARPAVGCAYDGLRQDCLGCRALRVCVP